jgi:signal transduction histidine kinase
MLVLAKLGGLALSQDRRMAQHEAELRAQDVAEQAADVLAKELQSFREKVTNPVVMFRDGWWPSTNKGIVKRLDADSATLRIEVNSANELVWPPPYELAPIPRPLDIAELTETQSILWAEVRLKSATNAPSYSVADTCRRFIAAIPPTNFLVAAHFQLGDALMRQNQERQFAEAEGCFHTLTNHYADAATESGLPVRPLAIFKKFQAQNAHANLSVMNPADAVAAYRNTLLLLVSEPTAITPELIREMERMTNNPPLSFNHLRLRNASTSDAQQEWEEHELARKIYTETFRQPKTPAARIISTNDLLPNGMMLPAMNPPDFSWASLRADDANTNSGRWLITHMPRESGSTWLCRAESEVRKRMEAALERVRKPEYLETSVRIAGTDVISSNRLQILEHLAVAKGGGQFWKRNNATTPPVILASAMRGEGGHALLAVSIHLTSPDLLYAQQEERATLFKLLIGASALASISGFLFAWRAFRKQLRLAEMKSNFVSSVSHELRAPIASVRLMAEGLERGRISEPAKQHEYFRFITQECRRLSSMIENVLDFARIEQGRKEYDFEPTDVAALVKQTVKLMEPYATERGVKLSTLSNAPPASHPEGTLENPQPLGESSDAGKAVALTRQDAGGTFLDGQAIQQALVNLIDNAIKHSPAGEEVTVGFALPNPQSAIRNLQFHVTDHGPGIPATEHEKIFERFYRLGSELRRETPGVGIGLSIVKHVAEAHGGRVRVESEVGKGSRFIIELPLNATEAQRHEGKRNE